MNFANKNNLFVKDHLHILKNRIFENEDNIAINLINDLINHLIKIDEKGSIINWAKILYNDLTEKKNKEFIDNLVSTISETNITKEFLYKHNEFPFRKIDGKINCKNPFSLIVLFYKILHNSKNFNEFKDKFISNRTKGRTLESRNAFTKNKLTMYSKSWPDTSNDCGILKIHFSKLIEFLTKKNKKIKSTKKSIPKKIDNILTYLDNNTIYKDFVVDTDKIYFYDLSTSKNYKNCKSKYVLKTDFMQAIKSNCTHKIYEFKTIVIILMSIKKDRANDTIQFYYNPKKGADGGLDGWIIIKTKYGSQTRIAVQVKKWKITVSLDFINKFIRNSEDNFTGVFDKYIYVSQKGYNKKVLKRDFPKSRKMDLYDNNDIDDILNDIKNFL